MVGKMVMGGMKVTCPIDEDVGWAVEGGLDHTVVSLPGLPPSLLPTLGSSGSPELMG
jgi:hypothetical protein